MRVCVYSAQRRNCRICSIILLIEQAALPALRAAGGTREVGEKGILPRAAHAPVLYEPAAHAIRGPFVEGDVEGIAGLEVAQGGTRGGPPRRVGAVPQLLPHPLVVQLLPAVDRPRAPRARELD